MTSRVIIDTKTYGDCTIGRLFYNNFQCFTLELPWLDNAPSVSCIPEGVYKAFKRESPANGPVLELKDVPNRTFIQIHAGNYTRQILGCLLTGDSVKWLDDDSIPDVTNSKNTLAAFLAAIPDEVEVEIRRS